MRPKQKILIHKCAQYAMASYTQITVDGNDTIDVIKNRDTDTIVYIICSGSTLYITGPGSESMTDWSLDFQIWRTRVEYFENSLVHAGFMKIYESIKENLHQKICALLSLKHIDHIVCTGHSLFGAVSTIIALDCTLRYESKTISCITFGSPRVGNTEFVKLFNENIDHSFRCVFMKDPITFTPIPLRFKHVKGSVYCNSKTAKSVSELEISKWNFCGCRIAHHSMDSYLQSTMPTQ